MGRQRAYTNGEGLRDYGPGLESAHHAAAPRWLIVLIAFTVGWLCGVTLQAAPVSIDTADTSETAHCVSLHVRPTALLMRGDIDVQTRVARHADHRALVVAWDSDAGMSGSRTLLLEGDRSPVLFQWWLPNYPAGNYVFDARVYDELGKERGRDRAVIQGVRP